MKRLALYLLLYTYTTIMLKPVLPYVSDSIAHIFWYSDHIATVHCEHGKYHVHYEYLEAAKKTYPEKYPNTQKKESPSNEHLVYKVLYDFSTQQVMSSQFATLHYPVISTSLGSDYPPPKV